MSDSDKSLHHIEEVEAIEEKQKRHTATIQLNSIRKEIVIYTASPVIAMTSKDAQILKQTEIQK